MDGSSVPRRGLGLKILLGTAAASGLAEAVRVSVSGATASPVVDFMIVIGVTVVVMLGVVGLAILRPIRRLLEANLELSRGSIEASRIEERETPSDEIGGVMIAHNLVLDKMKSMLDELQVANEQIRETSREIKEHKEKLHENYLVVEGIKDSLEEKNQRLREADRLKSEFLASMSHELRTPINAITGFTELTLKTQKGINDRGRRNLEKVIRSGHELVKLINDILDLSKIEAGKVTVQIEEFNLGEVIYDCLSTVEPLILDRDVHLEVRLNGDFRRIRQDRTKVRQIILNLVGNAAKFTEKGTISVTVDAVRGDQVPWQVDDASACLVRISVTDTGIGIAPEHLERVFDQFAQVEGGGSPKHGGTGLGLYIVKTFANLLGGDALAQSRPGRGSSFQVILPLVCVPSGKSVRLGSG